MGIKLWIFFAIYLLAVQNANSEQGISVVGDEENGTGKRDGTL